MELGPGGWSAPASVDWELHPGHSARLRPGWLADNAQWQHQLDAMRTHDVLWFEWQWNLASGAQPGFDMSWVSVEKIR